MVTRVWIWAATGVAAAALAGAVAVAGMRAAGSSASQPAAPARTDEYLGTELEPHLAAEFWLADQRGEVLNLRDFRGKVVALAFLDPLCTDSCPLTAFHFRLANEALGDRTGQVAFLVVNVNPNASVVAGTAKWGMGSMENWYFLTAGREVLKPIWEAYHVAAEAGPKPDRPDEQLHTSGVFLIDQEGRERWYISVPFADAGEDTTWLGRPLSELLLLRMNELLEAGR